MKKAIIALLLSTPVAVFAAAWSSPQDSVNAASVIDEVLWVVGDEAILKSDIEQMRLQAAQEGIRFKGNPDCAIPEQIAVQKLFLHQAAIDSIEVSESEIATGIDQQIESWTQMAGSREKLEEYKRQSISQMRTSLHDDYRDQMMVQKMRQKLVEDVKVTPAEVRRYFKDMPQDSLPFVPTEVEAQVITLTPKVEIEEINRVKDELREYTDRVNRGETSFSTLARLYSEDPVSARNGGELGYTGRGVLDPAFATVAFNLTDPTKVSKVVESEFGFHIIQLIGKRGDKVNVRHILRKPIVSDSSVVVSLERLDSIVSDVRAGQPPLILRDQFTGKWTFEDAVVFYSDDKDTRSNRGLMSNLTETGRTSKFRMQDLPQDMARVIDTMKVGEISSAFKMVTERGKTVCAVVKLKSRTESHRATINEDFQVLKDVVVARLREQKIRDWVASKIKATYVRINENYRDCEFEYQGWIR
ncbi:MAG: peptidylprolyl isomerase [Prevotella sp.]|jgi:peptidyl-prolyl cis-trans isomerase SurA|nr:peptidylprolyl isomerase [Prevotella sp.]